MIPSYNAGESLREIVRRASLVAGAGNVLVVDDGSTDGSSSGLSEEGVNVLRNEQNQGKGAALAAGFSYFLSRGYDGVVTVDSDGQHDPFLIPSLIDEAEKSGYGIVIGSRVGKRRAMPFRRLVGNTLGSLLISLAAGTRIRDSQSGFRFVSSDVLSRVTLATRRYETESELLIKASRIGVKLGAVDIPAVYGNERSFMNPLVDSARICLLALRSFFWKKQK